MPKTEENIARTESSNDNISYFKDTLIIEKKFTTKGDVILNSKR